MSAAADSLRSFFKRLAELEPSGESSFLANTEQVLRERDELLVVAKAADDHIDECNYEAEDITNVRGLKKAIRAAIVKAEGKQ